MRVISLLLALYLFSYSPIGNKKNVRAADNAEKGVTIKMHSPGLRYTFLNYCDENFQVKNLIFSNPTRDDTVICKTIWSEKPIHFSFGNFFSPSPKAKSIKFQCNFILLPGDTISLLLKNNGNIVPEKGINKSLLIDTLFGINQSELSIFRIPQINLSNPEGIRAYINSINNSFINVNHQIEDKYNSNQINDQRRAALSSFNTLFKYYKIINNFLSNKDPDKKFQRYYDSAFYYLRDHIDIFNKINTQISSSLISFIAAYEAQAKGLLQTKPPLEYYCAIDDSLLKTKIYRSFLLSKFANNRFIKNSDHLSMLINSIKERGIEDSRFDSLLTLRKHEEDLKNLKGVGIINAENDTISYYSIIHSLQGKYIFVHFWASWCSPCRTQMPYLKRNEKLFKNKDIVFVSISIDNDNQNREWIAASKDEGLYHKKFNYRLIKGNRNELLHVMKFTTVPRYILYNKKGIIIDNDFITPDNKNFVANLMAAVAKDDVNFD